MKSLQREIQIFPHGKKIKTISGQNLLEALILHGIFLRSDCGGKGKCSKCQVEKISEGVPPHMLQSCMYTVTEDIIIRIPEASMLSSYIISKSGVSFPDAFNEKFQHQTEKDVYGIAVDLGTTTIAVYLCNTAKGIVISSLSVKNPQFIYGHDVISRIEIIGQDPDNLDKLQKLVVESIKWGIKELLAALDTYKLSISEMVVVGNPTMIHILVGVDPKPIGLSPYKPAFHEAKTFQAADLGFDMVDVPVRILPQVSGFIGGDILAAALAVDLENQPEGTLLVDLGTNGELMMKGKDKLYATSCATGPAFEGASLSCGMQAIPGAINAVQINEDQHTLRYSMIDSKNSSSRIKPSGICGAGVISAVAQFCSKQIIDNGGTFTSGRKEYILVSEDPSVNCPSVYISQKDIRSVQLGKAALITGIKFLLKRAKLEQPEKIIITGGFGTHLSVSDMIWLGMIPAINIDKVESYRNLAGSGAIMALCSQHYIEKAIHLADKIKTVELACNIDFQDCFVQNLTFSSNHTQLSGKLNKL